MIDTYETMEITDIVMVTNADGFDQAPPLLLVLFMVQIRPSSSSAVFSTVYLGAVEV